MPSKSKSQQRLFCMALAVREKKLKRSEVDGAVLKIADSDMTDKQIRDFTVRESIADLKDYIQESIMNDEEELDSSIPIKLCEAALAKQISNLRNKKIVSNARLEDILNNIAYSIADTLNISKNDRKMERRMANITNYGEGFNIDMWSHNARLFMEVGVYRRRHDGGIANLEIAIMNTNLKTAKYDTNLKAIKDSIESLGFEESGSSEDCTTYAIYFN